MNGLILVIDRDLREFLQYKGVLVMRWFFFVAQVAVFGFIVSKLVTMPNYYQYYATGVVVMTLYSVAVFIGYTIYEEADHGIVEYLLSLPLKRIELVIGRSLAGGLRGLVHMAPIILGVMIAFGITDLPSYLYAFVSLFFFAFGVSGLSITLAVSLKSGDRFDIVMGVIDAFIVRLSTAMYPLAFMPAPIASLAVVNPLTYAADFFRWLLNLGFTNLSDPIVSISALAIFITTFNLIGVVIYERNLEGGGWR